MEASIGVSKGTKETLEGIKPPWMSWSQLLETLYLVADKKRLQGLIDDAFDEAEKTAVEHAKARYYRYRKNQQSLLSGGELKRRLKARQLKQQVHLLNKLMEERPDEQWMADPRIEALMSRADESLHNYLSQAEKTRKEAQEV